VIEAARERDLRVRGYVSMVFGDPWEGRVDPEQVASVAARLFALGCATISLGDTIGVGTPGQVQVVLQTVAAAGVPLGQVALHLHDTYGQALANVLAGLEAGVTEFDASTGGVGGCPFAKSATGNLATEDLVWMLDGLGIAHGLDLSALVSTSRWLAGHLGRPSPSRVVAALG
jgi:hydroxymethylglutaryl-CoA lyase